MLLAPALPAVSAAAAAAGRGGGAPPGAAELVVDTTYPAELCDAASQAFMEVTGGSTRVRFRRSRDPHAILERLRGEVHQGVRRAGVWWGGSAVLFAEAGHEGLLAVYAPRWTQGVLAHGAGAEGTWQSCHLLAFAPVFARVKGATLPDPPDPADLLDAPWKDHVVLLDPDAAPHGAEAFLVLVNGLLGGAPADDGALSRAKVALRRLEFNVRGVARSYDELARFAREDWVVTIAEVSDCVRAGLDDDPRFQREAFPGGTPVIPDGIAILARAPDPGAAKRFYDAVTSPAFLATAAGEHGRIPARRDVTVGKASPWLLTATERPRPIDAEAWIGAGDDLLEAWTGEIRGRRGRYERGLFLDNILTVVFTVVIFAVAWYVVRGARSGGGTAGGNGEDTWSDDDASREMAP